MQLPTTDPPIMYNTNWFVATRVHTMIGLCYIVVKWAGPIYRNNVARNSSQLAQETKPYAPLVQWSKRQLQHAVAC